MYSNWRASSFAVLLVLSVAACEDNPTGLAEQVHSLKPVILTPAGWVGQALPLQFRARDEQGRGVSGVEVFFSATAGGGTLSAASALTDSVGIAEVVLTLGSEGVGPQGGWNAVEARIDGPAEPALLGISTTPRPRVDFQVDTVFLSRPGGADTLFAGVLNDAGEVIIGESVDFTTPHPEVVSFHGIMTSGTYRGMLTGVRGERSGTTRVVATHRSGAADTVLVQVGPGG